MNIDIHIQHRGELCKLLDGFLLPRKIAEVGVAEGRFAEEIYRWGVSELYLIDIWEKVPFIEGCGSFEQSWHNTNHEEVKERFKDKEEVVILKGFSHKMAELIPDNHLGLVYIDADHTYNGVKADIQVWMPKLVKGGVMAFHDYMNPSYGVQRAVTEFMGGEGGINIIKEDDKIENMGAWIQKK